MKKLFLSFLVVMVGLFVQAQTEVLFDFDNNATALFGIEGRSSSDSNAGDFVENGVATVDGVTLTVSASESTASNKNRLWNSSPVLRMYGGTLSVAAPGYNISKIVFNAGSKFNIASCSAGELDQKTWTNNAIVDEVIFTIQSNTQIKSMTVTIAEVSEDVVMNPVFDPAAGQVLGGTKVTIACATEGATVYYTTDETTPTAASTAYTAPIAINDYTIIKAIAIKGENKSDVVTAEYTLIQTVSSLSSLSDFENGDLFIVGADLDIVYANDKYVYVKEGWTPALVYGTVDGAEAGKVINKGWMAKYTIFNGLPEILPVDAPEVVEGNGTVIEPLEVEAEDASGFIQAFNVNQYLKLMDVVIEDCSTTSFTGMIGETEVTFYKKFKGVEYPETAGTYNVTGFVSVYNGNVQFLPTSFEAAVEIETPTIKSLSALAGIPNNTTVIVGMPLTVVASVDFWPNLIVWDGTMYGAVGYWTEDPIAPGTVLEPNWIAIAAENCLNAGGELDLSQNGILPEVKSFDAEDIAQTQYPYNYVQLNNVEINSELLPIFGDTNGIMISNGIWEQVNVWNFTDKDIVKGQYNLIGFWYLSQTWAGAISYMFVITDVESIEIEPMTMEEAIGNWCEALDAYFFEKEWYAYPYNSYVTIKETENGVEISNLLGYGETLNGHADLNARKIILPAQDNDLLEGRVSGMNAAGKYCFDNGLNYIATADCDESITIIIDKDGKLILNPVLLSSDMTGEENWEGYNYLWGVINGTAERPYDIYLRGTMNEWKALDEWKFSTGTGEWYYIESVNIEAGVEFKIADANWGSINYGGAIDMDVDAYYTLEYNAGNCTLKTSLTNGTVWFNVMDGQVYFQQGTPTGINGIEAANGEAEFFNLQGVKVANPKAGDVYIRVVDGKASKVVVK